MFVCFWQWCCQWLSKNPWAPFKAILCVTGSRDDLLSQLQQIFLWGSFAAWVRLPVYHTPLVKFRHGSFNTNVYWLYFTSFWCCRNLKLQSLFLRPFIFHLLSSCDIQAQHRPPGRTDQYLQLVHSLVWHKGIKQSGRALISTFSASSKDSSWQAVLYLKEGKWDVGRQLVAFIKM